MSRDVSALIRAEEPTACRERFVLEPTAWREMAEALPHAALPLAGLWADGAQVHALFMDGVAPLIASVAVPDGRYHALSPARAGAQAHERIIHDLWGIEAMGARGTFPWLDQGHWPVTWPLRERPPPAPAAPEGVEFTDGATMHGAGGTMVGHGPADGGFQAPFYLRLGLPGARVGTVSVRMGYAHRGLCARMRGRMPVEGARLVARIEAMASVAHQRAFSHALAAATGRILPEGEEKASVFLSELERIASHLEILVQAAGLVADARFVATGASLLERVRQVCRDLCGRRFLFDVLPPAPGAARKLVLADGVVAELRAGCMELMRLFRRPRGLATRTVDRGLLPADVARKWGIAGSTARASGMEGDLRRYMPASRPEWTGGPLVGDVTARLAIRLRECRQGVEMLAALGGVAMPPVPPVPEHGSGEGLGLTEGPAGPVWHWLRLEGGRIAAWWCGDPSLAQVQALPDILSGAMEADVALILASLGLSAASADL
ncbi:NADH-quinone oxidoreductase [Komagataeibacter melaceti]|uniref:NADH-quinone oxidoreductase n=1 Tax=Komagataeibacter melaceti TaxID=2766577 RepID=A0A371Z162_9PROT|nr:NADH-quinone oxidoreductase [Komagataeibacter melaceti]RFD20242.1 NADH-quinone oxidoreductase [Komagataeibacter melaceti]